MNANLTERFNEIAAVSNVQQLFKRLSELATEPSTKKWVRNRDSAAQAWTELRELATLRAAAAGKAPIAAKRPVGRPPKATVPANDSPVATTAAS